MVIIYDLLLDVYSLFSTLYLLKSCPRHPFIYTIVDTALSLPLIYLMKSSWLLTAFQAACLTEALPFLEAQTPNGILTAGVQSLPLPSEAPGTIGVSVLLPAHPWRSLLIESLIKTIHVGLETAGHPHLQPFATRVIPSPSSTISVAGNKTIAQVKPLIAAATVSNIFGSPISTEAPPSVIGSRPDHPVAKLGIVSLFFSIWANRQFTRPLDESRPHRDE